MPPPMLVKADRTPAIPPTVQDGASEYSTTSQQTACVSCIVPTDSPSAREMSLVLADSLAEQNTRREAFPQQRLLNILAVADRELVNGARSITAI